MRGQAVGFGAGSVLSGLRSKSPYAKGLAMQSAAGLGMQRDKQNQDYGVQQMQADSQDRQQKAGNAAQAAGNAIQAQTNAGQMAARQGAFQIGLGYDYAAMARRNALDAARGLLSGMSQEY